MNKFLSVRDIVKDYRMGDESLRVLNHVSLDLAEGEFLAVVGASGAGKSTLLHIIGLLDAPSAGQIFFEGRDLASLSGLNRAGLRNTLFGFVFQFFHLLPDFTALENVMMPALVGAGVVGWHGRKAAVKDRAAQLLDRVGLAARASHRPTQLSGGERQRVALCRALINQPRVLLLDEPTGNLDSHTGQQIHDLILTLNSEGQSIVMVTHNEAAAKRTSRLVRIRDGEMVNGN